MSACCSGGCSPEKPPVDARYRRILWIALLVNGGMFGVELISGWHAGSVSLLADALDFFGDAANYGLSLFVLALAPVWRSRAALVKGLSMGGYGLFILGTAAWNFTYGTVPEASTMGKIGLLALAANLSVAALLYAYRNGDANMRSVWLCTRNDAIGNIAVMLAALGVFGTGSGWPDIVVAGIMGSLGVSAAVSVVRHAREEIRAGAFVLKKT
ncbi:cation transporter [Noviherbaspirillum massiliense]|uniref:cation transporter n=1 Tax=Noviherbaspirillum massiliense TaxID=1465823 RepID=UPI0004750D2D|nr:cation transporter [Noviherbaspirillum massiliense]